VTENGAGDQPLHFDTGVWDDAQWLDFSALLYLSPCRTAHLPRFPHTHSQHLYGHAAASGTGAQCGGHAAAARARACRMRGARQRWARVAWYCSACCTREGGRELQSYVWHWIMEDGSRRSFSKCCERHISGASSRSCAAQGAVAFCPKCLPPVFSSQLTETQQGEHALHGSLPEARAALTAACALANNSFPQCDFRSILFSFSTPSHRVCVLKSPPQIDQIQ
jgi:hypothetical protein